MFTQRISLVLSAVFLFCSAATVAHAALNVVASSDISPVRPGQLLNVEFVVTNTDAFARAGVTLEMTYPAGLNQLFETAFEGDCASTTCSAGELVTWTIGTIPAGGAVVLDVPAFVGTGTADGTITFASTVTDDFLVPDSASTDVEVDADALYELAMSEDSDPALAGENVAYKITFAYRDDATTVNASSLRFAVPAGATFVSATDGGAVNGGDVEWSLGKLSPGEGGVRRVTVSLDNGLAAGDVVAGTAEVFSDAAPAENAVAETLTVIASADPLGIAIESSTDPARLGEQINLQLMVSNSSPFTRFNVVLTAIYPQLLFQLFESEFRGDCVSTTCSAGERVTWTLGNIAAGGSVTVAVPATVSTGVSGAELINFFAEVTDSTGLAARQMESVRIQSDAQYDLSLSENSDPAIAGSLLTYKLTYGFRADAAAVNQTTLRFPVPSGTTFVSASGGGVESSGNVDWSLGFLSPGDGGTREVTVQLSAGLTAAAIIEAAAQVSSVSSPIETARAEANTVITAGGGLALALEVNPGAARPGELANLQFTVTNNDPFTRFGVVLESNYPQHIFQVFETEFEGNCASTTCSAGELIAWPAVNIGAGETVTFVLPPTVLNSPVSGQLTDFFAWAQDDQGLQTWQSDTLRVQDDTVYDLSLAENSDPAVAGAIVTYKLVFGYRNDAAAVADSTLRFPVPAGATFVSATDGGALSSGTVDWSLGFLSPGDSGVREVTVQFDGSLATGSVVEAAAEVFSVSDPVEVARAEANTVIAGSVPLSLTIESNPDSARPNELANFQLIVSNNDAFTRFGVTPKAQFPQPLFQTFESEFDGDCSSTTCTSGELITWPAVNIPAGGTVTVDLPPTVISNAISGTLLDLFAWAQDDQGVQTRQADAIRIQDDTLYDLALDENEDPATAGSQLTYKLTYGYRADAAAVNDSILRLPVPAGTTFVSATDGGVLNGDTVDWSLGFLSPGDGGIREATVSLDGGLSAGTVVEADAELGGVSAAVERARAEADTVIVPAVSLDLDIDPVTFTAEPNRRLRLDLTVTNNDPFTRFGVSLQARFPESVFQLFESEPDFVGDCGSTTCTTGERITWPLVDIPAGGSVTVTLPPIVINNIIGGTLINLFAWVSDDLGVQARDFESLYTGCISVKDNDCDGVLDTRDNCLGTANTSQCDTDSDGFGNNCDADLDNTCFVNFFDLLEFKNAFSTQDLEGDHDCNDFVNFGDLSIFGDLFGAAPGPTALPNACSQ